MIPIFWSLIDCDFLFDILSITVGLYSAAILPEIQFSPYIDIAEHVLPPLLKGIFIVSIPTDSLFQIFMKRL